MTGVEEFGVGQPSRFQARILIVDDQPLMLSLLRQTLKRLGFKDFCKAADGSAALAMLASDRMDLVITDLHMPNLSGFDLIQAIRRQETTKDLPIIVVSGENAGEMVIKAMQSRANSFILKPFAARASVPPLPAAGPC